jgi:hypothetical protein
MTNWKISEKRYNVLVEERIVIPANCNETAEHLCCKSVD